MSLSALAWYSSIIILWGSLAASEEPKIERKCYISPCEIKGDFDGDKKQDMAVLVVNKDGVRGVQIKLGSKKNITLGAGTSFGNGGNDFYWLDSWRLYQGEVFQGAEDSKPPVLKGDALLVEKSGSASGIVYWDGSKFRWYQQGD